MRRTRAELERLRRELDAEYQEAGYELPRWRDRSDVLPAADRWAVAAVVESWPSVGGRRETRDKWSAVVSEAIKRPKTLGLISVGRGGLPALAQRLLPEAARPEAALSRNLQTWAEKELVVLYEGDRVKRFAPLEGIFIPRLSVALVALMRDRALFLGGGGDRNPWTARDRAVALVRELS